MKTKILTFGLLIIFAFAACERKNYNPGIEELDDSGVLSEVDLNNPQDSTNTDSSEILNNFCGTPQVFELWYSEDFSYGNVAVFNDTQYIYIFYNVNKELAAKGWGIHSTYLFLGNYDDLSYMDNGSIDWYSSVIDIENYNDNPSSVLRIVPIDQLSYDCFGIATKVKMNNPDPGGMNPNPRAFINVDGKLNYPWKTGYSYCIQTCSD